MVGLERGAVYVPGFRRDGQPVAGPDEDAFTMAVTALETLVALPPAAPSPPTIHLVGSFPSVAEWGFAAFLGHPVEVVRYPPGGLRAALASAGNRTDPTLLVTVDVPTPAGSAHGARTEGPGAVALRLGPAGIPLPVLAADIGGGLTAARSLLAHLPPGAVAARVDPIALDPAPEAQVRPFADAPPVALSEGAYVPRARYLENLPARWRLEAVRCARCRGLTFPARARCRSCGAEEGLAPELLPPDGARVVAATTIGKGGQPTEFDGQVEALGEYSVVLAEFAHGVRLTLQVTDAAPGEVQIGARIGTRVRRLYPMEGEWRYGRKAVPLPPGIPDA